jgi:hypothetical protein
MTAIIRAVSVPVLLVVTGCALAIGCTEDPNNLRPGNGGPTGDSDVSSSGGGGGGGGGDGGRAGDASTDAPPGTKSDGGDGGDPPTPCKPGLTSVPLALTPNPDGPVRATTTADGGTLVAWGDGGTIHVRNINAAGTTVSADRTVAGTTVHGIAAMPDGVALLVARAPDKLLLVKLGAAGNVVFEKLLSGNSDHAVVGSEWFSYDPTFFAESGRLVWTGSKLIAYMPIFRRWPDNIAHTGDTLRNLDANGNPTGGTGWSWGCSHSLDVRLSADGTVPICLSDCYPEKAIVLGRNSVVSEEPSGNCAGSSNTKLGGLTTVAGASWLTFASSEGRSSRDVVLMKIGDPTKRYLTQGGDASSPHLAAFGNGMVAGWRIGNVATVQRLDTQGNTVGAPENVSATPFGEGDDFLSWPGGDAGWLSSSGNTWKLARLGACD